MTTPRISVVMPCFNAAGTLEETLDSLRLQTLADWELVAVDDGSTDATGDILSKAAASDPRIKPVKIDNGGPSRARNLGALCHARAKVIAFLDADDVCAPERLERLVTAFEARPVSSAFYGRVAFFQHDPRQPDTVSTVRRRALSTHVLLGENPVCTTSNLAVRKSALRAVGGFDESLVHHEDVDLLLRLADGGARIDGIDEILVHYRTSQDSLSADLSAMRRGWWETLARFDHKTGIDRATARQAEAIHLRYLARRALRLNRHPREAVSLAMSGLCRSPTAFFDIPRRGALTLGGSLLAPLLPSKLRRRLFA